LKIDFSQLKRFSVKKLRVKKKKNRSTRRVQVEVAESIQLDSVGKKLILDSECSEEHVLVLTRCVFVYYFFFCPNETAVTSSIVLRILLSNLFSDGS